MAYESSEPEVQGEAAQPVKGEGRSSSKSYLDMIESATKCFTRYQELCDNVDKLYADLSAKADVATDRQFQIFWANLEVLKPSIYSRPPVPVAVPRFKDRKELPRKASEILERCLISSFEADDIDATMRLVRDDLAVNARGVVWMRYEEPEETGQKVCKEHLDRKDFLHDPARKWSEVEWVARRSWLTRKRGLKRFGDTWLKAEFSEKDTDKEDDYKGTKKAAVWELWHKTENKVVWVTPGVDDVLDEREPFLKLEGFFPCPRPAYGTLKRRTLLPVPDFVYYKDQVEEINELTARISALSESLRLKGFYPGGASDVGEAIEAVLKDQSNTATLVPISSLAAFGSNGSIKDSIIWLPVKDVADVITALVALRKQLIDDVYQISGLSDIMRGETEASETATAQRIKTQYGSVRIRDKQYELTRLARDVTRIEAEIMAENFTAETLVRMSQVDDLPTDQNIQQQVMQIEQQARMLAADPVVQQRIASDPQAQQEAQQALQQVQQQIEALKATLTIDKVVAMLREQRVRPFVLEIETDSTIQPDEDASKQRATEFITAVGGYMQQAVGAVQMVPEMAPLASEMLKYVASQFRAGRSVDGAIDDFADKMKEAASQPKPPNPEQVKAEADAKAREADAAAKQQEGAQRLREMQAAALAKRDEYSLKMNELQAKAANDERMAEIQRETAQVNLELKRLDVLIKKADLAAKGMEETEDGSGVSDKSDRHAATIIEALNSQSTALADALTQMAGAMKEMAEVQARPRSVVGPSGRTYTATVN